MVTMLSEAQSAALTNATLTLPKSKRVAVEKWTESVVMGHGLLEAVIAGHMQIIDYHHETGPMLRITEAGEKHVEQDLLPQKPRKYRCPHGVHHLNHCNTCD